MNKVYICSPYRATNVDELHRNIAYAQEMTLQAIKAGAAPYTPHLYLPNILDDSNAEAREQGMSVGLEFLMSCDVIWVCGKYGISEGMRKEIEMAQNFGISVVEKM